MSSRRWVSTFRRNMLALSSGANVEAVASSETLPNYIVSLITHKTKTDIILAGLARRHCYDLDVFIVICYLFIYSCCSFSTDFNS
jgi:hypothetical protein